MSKRKKIFGWVGANMPDRPGWERFVINRNASIIIGPSEEDGGIYVGFLDTNRYDLYIVPESEIKKEQFTMLAVIHDLTWDEAKPVAVRIAADYLKTKSGYLFKTMHQLNARIVMEEAGTT